MAGFDWTSFTTALLEGTAANINERKDEAKTWQLQQEELAVKNTGEFQKRKNRVNTVLGYTTYLTQNGATDAQIQAAIATGPDGVIKFTDAVQKAVKLNGGRPLAESEVSTIISVPENFRSIDMGEAGIKGFIEQSFGLSGADVGVSDQPQISWMERAMGTRARDVARGNLDKTVMYQGMTARDLNEMAQSAEYSSLIPGTLATFTANLIDASVIEGMTDTLNSQTAKIKLSPEFKALIDAREAAISQDNLEIVGRVKGAEVSEIDKKMKQMLAESAGGAMDIYINQYGAGIFDTMGGLLEQNFGSEWVASRKNGDQSEVKPTVAPSAGGDLTEEALTPTVTTEALTPTVTTEAPPQPGAPIVDAALDEALAENLTLAGGELIDGGADPATNQKITILAHPDVAGGEQIEIIRTIDTGIIVSASVLSTSQPIETAAVQPLIDMYATIAADVAYQVKETPAVEPTREGWSIGLDYKEAPTEDYYVATIGGMYGNKEFKVSAKQLKYFPDYNIETGNVRLRKFEKGESMDDMPMKSSDNLGYIFRHSPPTGEVPAVVKDEPTPLGGVRPKARPDDSRFRNAEPEKDLEMWYTPTSNESPSMKALTKQFGTDIATAVIESGAKDYYEVSKVVTKWADDNNKVMPTDIENLISQLVAEVNKDEGGN
jgi:hypothetical protein